MPDRPYLAEVEEFFLSIVRKGLTLRAHDVDVIRDWEARGVPLAVVQRGILEGVRRFMAGSDPTSPLPSSLKYYRTFVETEFDRWRRASDLHRTFDAMRIRPRAGTFDPIERAMTILAERSAREANPFMRQALEATARHLRDLATRHASPTEALDEADDFLVQAYLDTVPPEVRNRIDQKVRERVAEAKRRGVGVTALRDIERKETREAVMEESGFEGLIALITG